MKKAIIALVILIVIGFIPFQQHSSVSIRSNYFDVCQQLIHAGNWKRWEPQINNYADHQISTQSFNSGFLIRTPSQIFNIKNVGANTFNVVNTLNHIEHHSFYTVVPEIKNSYATIVIDAKTNVFKWLISRFEPSAEPAYLMLSLKAFMENPRLYYGFTINEKNVAETYLAVKKETILTKNKYPEINKAANDINSFIAQSNIKAVSSLSGSYYPHQSDSLQILIGIPVNKQVNSTSAITFMHMPGGKVVVGDYYGKYSERQKLYTAMEKYIQDHDLKKQVLPFERYLNNKVPVGDNDMVNMQVNYPVL
ncbi:GyrI-like domain-containing protein [Mucilaginibacter lappiensis]|jgi:effector-binding domain-containing protein|uniref:GyrI-like domain-containing protein n=1 Tax=Mucilaginibacter lappiensis TaxID=354630 RepID=UPI003D1E775E